MSEANELEAIRARHWVAGQYVTLALDAGQAAHRDRETLLAHVDRLAAELAEVREAWTVIVEGAQLSEYQSLSDSEGLSVQLCRPDCLEDLTFGDLRRLNRALKGT